MNRRIKAPPDATQGSIPIFDLGGKQQVTLPLSQVSSDLDIWGWSPDGCSLLVSTYSGHQETFAVNIVTLQVASISIRPDQAHYSPTGEWIAYSTFDRLNGDPLQSEVYVIHPDGSDQIQLTGDGKNNWFYSWSPDGQKVLYWTQAEGKSGAGVQELYAVDINSLDRCLVARVPEPLERWEDLDLAEVDTCRPIPMEYSGVVENAGEVWVDYAPGYNYVRIVLEQPGGGGEGAPLVRLVLLDTRTGAMQSVPGREFYLANTLAWSPGGDTLALVAWDLEGDSSQEPRVYLVDAKTGQAQGLDVEPGFAPSWSPDGNWLAFQSSELEQGPFVFNLGSREITHLPVRFNEGGILEWSPQLSYQSVSCR